MTTVDALHIGKSERTHRRAVKPLQPVPAQSYRNVHHTASRRQQDGTGSDSDSNDGEHLHMLNQRYAKLKRAYYRVFQNGNG